MIFNIVGRNQDDYAKNFAFTMDKNGIWNLSPVYDITYSNGAGYTKNHQFSLNGKTNNFIQKDILQLAKNIPQKKLMPKNIWSKLSKFFQNLKIKPMNWVLKNKR